MLKRRQLGQWRIRARGADGEQILVHHEAAPAQLQQRGRNGCPIAALDQRDRAVCAALAHDLPISRQLADQRPRTRLAHAELVGDLVIAGRPAPAADVPGDEIERLQLPAHHRGRQAKR